MKYPLKSTIIFFLIALTSIAAVSYLRFGDKFSFNSLNALKESPNVFWEEASIKVITNWGLCSPTFPCYETYELNSELSSSGKIFHNDKLAGNLSISETKKFIRASFYLYQNNICTPFHTTEVSEKYELKIDERLYEFGSNKGCKEMQTIINTLKKRLVYN